MNNIFGTKLKELRESKGMSLQELGSLVEVSKQTIHCYEKAHKNPSSSTVLRLGKSLGVHPSFFFQDKEIDIKIEELNFREEQNILNSFDYSALIDNSKTYLLNLLELKALLDIKSSFINPISNLEIHNKKDVEKAAKNLRKKWHLGYAPISNITSIIENNGISVIELDINNGFTGISGVANKEIPFIIVNRNLNDITRKRFTLLHELGHLTLKFHKNIEKESIEQLCHHFAGAILLVDDTLKLELGANRTQISLSELREIKEKYGISIKAIIMRAGNTDIISRHTQSAWFDSYKEWYENSNSKTDFGIFQGDEKPTLFNKLLSRGIQEQRFTIGKAAKLKATKIDILQKELNELTFNLY